MQHKVQTDKVALITATDAWCDELRRLGRRKIDHNQEICPIINEPVSSRRAVAEDTLYTRRIITLHLILFLRSTASALYPLLLLTLCLPSLPFRVAWSKAVRILILQHFHWAASSACLFQGSFHANEGIFRDYCYLIILCPQSHGWPFVWRAPCGHGLHF